MNKQISLMASILTLVTSTSAFAIVLPGWDRPVSKAEMTVLNQQGSLPSTIENAKTIELVMTQQDGSQSPAGFVLLIDGQYNQAYQVTESATDNCGSTTYTLAPVQKPGTLVLDETSESLHVINHSDRLCMDLHKYQWELDVKNSDLLRQVIGQARLAGNPEALITPM
jgi:hypothetical protein